jgi:hypothetical protein
MPPLGRSRDSLFSRSRLVYTPCLRTSLVLAHNRMDVVWSTGLSDLDVSVVQGKPIPCSGLDSGVDHSM